MGSLWQEVTESFGQVGPARAGVDTHEDKQLPHLSPIPSPKGAPATAQMQWEGYHGWSAETPRPGFILERDVFLPHVMLDFAARPVPA